MFMDASGTIPDHMSTYFENRFQTPKSRIKNLVRICFIQGTDPQNARYPNITGSLLIPKTFGMKFDF